MQILRKIFTMRAGDYERIINYDWPYLEFACFHEIIFLKEAMRWIAQKVRNCLFKVFVSLACHHML